MSACDCEREGHQHGAPGRHAHGMHPHHGHECGCGGGGHDHPHGGDCGCGEGGHQHHHGGECGCGEGGGFRRRFVSRAERIAALETYLKDLRAEAEAVEERLAEMKEAGHAGK